MAKGDVYLGAIPVVAPKLEEQGELLQILTWADEIRRLMVWANADDEKQASRARSYGAQGIGLCRTEHMFLGDRTALFQNYILAERRRSQGCGAGETAPNCSATTSTASSAR